MWQTFCDNSPNYFCGLILDLDLPELLRKFCAAFINLCSKAVEHSTCIQHSHGKVTAPLFEEEHPNTTQTKLEITINGKN